MRTLEGYRGRDFVGVEDLAQAAAALIERYSAEPARGNVRLGITPRIVRHYLSEDLLGVPTGHAGTSIVFNYGNLLRLLAVKKLLADNWSVIKIKEFMHALDITALEQLVNSALKSVGRPPQRQREPELEREINPHHAPRLAQPQPAPPLAALAVESAQRATRSMAQWIELAPGLEIKVRRGFRLPRNEQERNRLMKRFWSVIDRNIE